MSETIALPSVLVISCSEDKSSKEIISDLLQGACPPEPEYQEENIDGYRWNISTKYYTAAVNVCAPKHRTVPSQQFAESVEAVLLYFSPQSRAEFIVMQSWLRTIDQVYSPAVKLLICQCSEDADEVPRQEVLTFCLDRHIELIELAPVNVDSDEEEFGGSPHGYGRVRSALFAHTWSNLEMKPDSLRTPRGVAAETTCAGELRNEERLAESLREQEAVTEPREQDVDVFEQLFSQLHHYRATAENLSGEDRRTYAEKVTKQFWKSMGDDSDELSDSD